MFVCFAAYLKEQLEHGTYLEENAPRKAYREVIYLILGALKPISSIAPSQHHLNFYLSFYGELLGLLLHYGEEPQILKDHLQEIWEKGPQDGQ